MAKLVLLPRPYVSAVVLVLTGGVATAGAPALAQQAGDTGSYVDVTIETACQVLEPVIERGLAARGVKVVKAVQLCPSRTGVLVHQPEKNMFFLRDAVRVASASGERIVPFSAEVRYTVNAQGRPDWTQVEFRCEDKR